ncbi:MAG: dinitrogenase iron-molybdenum cofactor biosynthesis protein [Clostridiales bacterium]|jgi:predicted Fe-Mo cluster-binding NifX family protein|nr:dinitrogenase iron-molybdenum cofactor biosynthesis protein [Clostridiales bacterium]
MADKIKVNVAVASTDGKVINTHFGRAKNFYIVQLDVGAESYEYIESRDVSPSCKDFDHSEHDFDAVAAALSDCRYILVAKAGYGAISFMESKGITVLESGDFIEPAISKLIKYLRRLGKGVEC